jgi:hypothetical protein
VTEIDVTVSQVPSRKTQERPVAKKVEKPRKITPPSIHDLAEAIKALEDSISEIRKSEDFIKKELLEIKNNLLELNRLSEDNPRRHL